MRKTFRYPFREFFFFASPKAGSHSHVLCLSAKRPLRRGAAGSRGRCPFTGFRRGSAPRWGSGRRPVRARKLQARPRPGVRRARGRAPGPFRDSRYGGRCCARFPGARAGTGWTGDGLTDRELSDYAELIKREVSDLEGVDRVELWSRCRDSWASISSCMFEAESLSACEAMKARRSSATSIPLPLRTNPM